MCPAITETAREKCRGLLTKKTLYDPGDCIDHLFVCKCYYEAPRYLLPIECV